MLWASEKIIEQKGEIPLGPYGRTMPRYAKFKGRNFFGSTYIREVYIGGEFSWSSASQSISFTRYTHVTLLDKVMTKFLKWLDT